MDIQKLEHIVLEDAKTDAQNLINKTKKESEKWLLEQSRIIKNEHLEEIDRINSEHTSMITNMKASLAADFHKSLVKAKKDKISFLKSELLNSILTKINQTPEWILEKAFLDLTMSSGEIVVSEDIAKHLNKEKTETFLKKHPGFTWNGIDKTMNSGIAVDYKSVRYLFPLEEIIDDFVEKSNSQIESLLIP
jgi:uncharacterized protein with gpF-like domain